MLRFTHENIFIADHARPRQRWLILFSLDVNYRRFIVIILGAVGVIAFFSSFAYDRLLMSASPIAPDPGANQIYQMNEHGYLYYVTRQQYWLFHTLVWGGWGLFAIAGALNYRWKVIKNLTRDGWRLPI